jgi:2-dehydro-3-deoxyphosphogluconate aldolase/(4S)-4-hydroxy-2-oxoglutarate aldolase
VRKIDEGILEGTAQEKDGNAMKASMEKLQKFFDLGVMAIVRIDSKDNIDPTLEALLAAGLNIIEISLVTPHAVEFIGRIHDQFGDQVTIGAGTVLDEPSARAAILSGADFIVSPTLQPDVIRITKRYGKLNFAGGFTPTECLRAWESGADAVKLFPAMPAGPAYLKAVNAPMKQIPLVAVGGVSAENLASWFEAGAVGVAGASNLVSPQLVNEGKFDQITKTAREWLRIAGEARKP